MTREIIGGVALLLNRMTPLALTILGPVMFNILLFHITMAPAGLPPALFVTALWSVVAYSVRPAFAGLFTAAPSRNPSPNAWAVALRSMRKPQDQPLAPVRVT